jgi:hypothetical protein
VRGGRVRWIAVTRRAVLRSGRARHAALRAVGLR